MQLKLTPSRPLLDKALDFCLGRPVSLSLSYELPPEIEDQIRRAYEKASVGAAKSIILPAAMRYAGQTITEIRRIPITKQSTQNTKPMFWADQTGLIHKIEQDPEALTHEGFERSLRMQALYIKNAELAQRLPTPVVLGKLSLGRGRYAAHYAMLGISRETSFDESKLAGGVFGDFASWGGEAGQMLRLLHDNGFVHRCPREATLAIMPTKDEYRWMLFGLQHVYHQEADQMSADRFVAEKLIGLFFALHLFDFDNAIPAYFSMEERKVLKSQLGIDTFDKLPLKAVFEAAQQRPVSEIDSPILRVLSRR